MVQAVLIQCCNDCSQRPLLAASASAAFFCIAGQPQGTAESKAWQIAAAKICILSIGRRLPHYHRLARRHRLLDGSRKHSLKNQPDEFIFSVPSQLVENIPSNVPRALLPEYITELCCRSW
ncbi:hypothetical protein FVF58_29555 [Paraburkholderia panacisoli]|uniref:Uncharacterized protein n=1 Tax=Paraburkholderia panacisoli TaxID=2603818 RepID=A0A5B0GR30_9BURK|nr:hypothetical protein FVF58_29555 [Paraburkholderia panacisoli]